MVCEMIPWLLQISILFLILHPGSLGRVSVVFVAGRGRGTLVLSPGSGPDALDSVQGSVDSLSMALKLVGQTLPWSYTANYRTPEHGCAMSLDSSS